MNTFPEGVELPASVVERTRRRLRAWRIDSGSPPVELPSISMSSIAAVEEREEEHDTGWPAPHPRPLDRQLPPKYDSRKTKSMNKYWPSFVGMLIALVLFEFAIFHTTIARSNLVGNGYDVNYGWQPETMPVAGRQRYSATNNDFIICPSALKLFDNATEVVIAIANNIQFHQRGGNLHSIEKYLNSHMGSTLRSLNVQFTPKGEKNPTENAVEYLQDYYEKNNVARGGYGQPLPGALSSKYGNNIINQVLFEKRWINVVEPPILGRFDAGVGPVGPDCSHKVSFSEGTYEQKTICIVPKGDAQEQQQPKEEPEECNILSIGSNDQWGFEEEVMQKLPGCVTHTFDCTLKNMTPQKKPKTNNIKFYPHCIGSNDAQPPYLPYEKIWSATQTNTPPKLLKMDVEGFEYDVINTMLSSDQSIWPEQIMMEVHWATRMVDIPWMPRTRTAAEIALFFGELFNHGGYIVAHSSVFPGCQPCMEVLLVRVMC